MTIDVPMSGCRKTSAMGTPATTVARATSGSQSSASRTSERSAASMRISAIFMYSDGAAWKPPSWNQRCAPFTLVPSGVCTSTSSASTAT